MADASKDTVLLELARRFPRAFVAERWARHTPLARGIDATIRDACPDLFGKAIRRAMARYCGRLMYRKALMIPGAVRVDLIGHPAGVVTPSEAAHAARQVREMLQIRSAESAAALERCRQASSPRSNPSGRSAPPKAATALVRGPRGVGLAELRAAALARRARAKTVSGR